jgi:hypothetical protein
MGCLMLIIGFALLSSHDSNEHFLGLMLILASLVFDWD